MPTLMKRLSRADRSRGSNKRARRVLAGMTNKLSAALKKQCDEYAVEMLGSKSYAPWLHVYANTAGTFHEGWIPDNYYNLFVVRAAKHKDISNRRAFGPMLFGHEYFPDMGHLSERRCITTQGDILRPQALIEYLFDQQDRVIFKQDSSAQGKGILFFTKDTLTAENLLQLGDGTFQRIIRQHPMFDDLSQDSVATLRITTASGRDGPITVRGTYLRLGRSRETHVQSASALRVEFDRDTGDLSDVCYLPDWNPTPNHPDTGASLAGRQIPDIKTCTDLVLKLHKKYALQPAIGWDLAIDGDGRPHVLEWNDGHNGIKFNEAVQGPQYRDTDWSERWRYM